MFCVDDVECEIPDDLNIYVEQKVSETKVERMPLPYNNDTQDEAIAHALSKKFTIIQGPPGKLDLQINNEREYCGAITTFEELLDQ